MELEGANFISIKVQQTALVFVGLKNRIGMVWTGSRPACTTRRRHPELVHRDGVKIMNFFIDS
jgi:hypothetical protein